LSLETNSSAAVFLEELKRLGFDFFTGVPCSLLRGAMALLEHEPPERYLPAVREDLAFGLAAGAYLGGRRPAVFIQNSGLGVSVNALASLLILYRLPCLMVVSWRGWDGEDAPEHLLTGATTPALLDLLEIRRQVLEPHRLVSQLRELAQAMDEQLLPVACLVKPGILE
jgi:sulfopyruvate decarboxylase subunit alpha